MIKNRLKIFFTSPDKTIVQHTAELEMLYGVINRACDEIKEYCIAENLSALLPDKDNKTVDAFLQESLAKLEERKQQYETVLADGEKLLALEPLKSVGDAVVGALRKYLSDTNKGIDVRQSFVKQLKALTERHQELFLFNPTDEYLRYQYNDAPDAESDKNTVDLYLASYVGQLEDRSQEYVTAIKNRADKLAKVGKKYGHAFLGSTEAALNATLSGSPKLQEALIKINADAQQYDAMLEASKNPRLVSFLKLEDGQVPRERRVHAVMMLSNQGGVDHGLLTPEIQLDAWKKQAKEAIAQAKREYKVQSRKKADEDSRILNDVIRLEYAIDQFQGTGDVPSKQRLIDLFTLPASAPARGGFFRRGSSTKHPIENALQQFKASTGLPYSDLTTSSQVQKTALRFLAIAEGSYIAQRDTYKPEYLSAMNALEVAIRAEASNWKEQAENITDAFQVAIETVAREHHKRHWTGKSEWVKQLKDAQKAFYMMYCPWKKDEISELAILRKDALRLIGKVTDGGDDLIVAIMAPGANKKTIAEAFKDKENLHRQFCEKYYPEKLKVVINTNERAIPQKESIPELLNKA